MKPGMWVWKTFAVAMVVAGLAGEGAAQDYPSRAITVVVPFPPGGASDVVARIVTNQMSKILGQSIIIENVGGAGGTVGSARVAAATPDGYTLLAAAMGSHVAAPVLTPNLKYDPVADFVPIGFTAHSPAVVIARKDFPANDLKEFVAALRQRGDAVKLAHGGIGASSHMACLLFTAEVGAKPALVAYRGSGPALNDLVAGVTQFFFDNLTTSIEFMRAGKLRALGLTSARPNPLTPDVPPIAGTMPELKPFDVSTWFGVFLPARTPRPVVDAYNAEMKVWLSDPRTLERFKTMAGFPAYGSPEEFDTFVNAQIALWKSVIDKEGLKMDVN